MTLTIVLMASILNDSGEVADSEVRAAIERSIPYIEDRGVWWMEKKKCVSCHRIGTMVWSLAAARSRGIKVSDKLDEWFDWSLEKSKPKPPTEENKDKGFGNKDGLVQLMLPRKLFKTTDARTKSLNTFPTLITQDQQADGSWNPGGQLPSQKRSKVETTEVTTMWLALGLAEFDSEGNQKAIDQALERLSKIKRGKSTEWFVAGLLLASQLNDDAEVKTLLAELTSQQQADGGWGWIIGEPSDALATGMVLYALQQSDGSKAASSKAARFLVKTQSDNGSWAVRGTKKNKQKKVAESATYWGTTWAVIGLAESLAN
ncbi:MAG: hypothetical protein CMJ78_07320 [Planctomycetaceae bacterium]|nr:hypothetical protein [Planctomycetaceae bacterium]